jgi:acyl transferase domain-containing protein/phosphopantetheinyl transferase
VVNPVTTTTDGVAIVGMAVLLPGAGDLDAYWRNLREGVDSITDAPTDRWDQDLYRAATSAADLDRAPDRIYCRRGGFVDDLADVDVARFGIMPTSVDGTEPDQLIALRVAAQAVADSGGEDRLPDRDRVGVVLGRGGYLTPGIARLDQRVRTAHQLVHTLGELLPDLGREQLAAVREAFTERLGPTRPEAAIGLVPNLAASRIANRLDLRGPAYTVDAACASSLIAVDQAISELASGRCDVMLAGGVHHCHDITLWSVFAQLGALSPSERSRPFHRDADGILIGEGTGIVVLKRLADADRDGDRVYAVIRGTGVSSDGRGTSLLIPDAGGQVRAVRQAWARAGLDPTEADSIGLLEAHGTATPAGDAAELATLAEVFGSGAPAVIGSVKSMIGHTMPAAGVAGLIKAALAIHHRTLPPTLHCDDPHPDLAGTRFRPVESALPWETDGAPRRAGVNAFGFGGVNAHVVIEEPPSAMAHAPISVVEPERVLMLAADHPQALAGLLDRDDAHVRASATGSGPTRLSIVDPTPKRLALARRLAGAPTRSWRGRNDVWFYPQPLLGAGGGRVAFVFPGLEAEFAPNVEDLVRHFGVEHSATSSVGDVGRHGLAVVRLGRLLDDVLRRIGIVPDGVAGHSVGEWTAMITSGVYAGRAVDEFLAGFDPDALRVPDLAFAAVGTSAQRVAEVLLDHPDVVLSHDNAPTQSMVCGPVDAVDALARGLRAQRVVCQVLPFQSGFHTPMLAPYLDPIRQAAASFDLQRPTVPIWSATTASTYPAAAEAVRELFVRHLLEPVRFRPLIEEMYAAGYRVFVQTGTGQLTSLVTDILGDSDHLTVAASSGSRGGVAQLRRVAAAMWAAGGSNTLPALESGRAKQEASSRTSVRLNLGGALVSLEAPARTALRSIVATARPAARQSSTLDTAAVSSPMAAEFRALLDETADLVGTVLAARQTTPRQATPRQATPRSANGLRPVNGVRSVSRPVNGSGSVPPPATGAGSPPPRAFSSVLRVNTEAMPYLLDHCFFKQRADWPDDADRWPVVPATTVVGHLMDFAEQAAPGRVAVAVHDVVLNRWINAIPSVDIPVSTRSIGADRIEVSLGQYSKAVVELAEQRPTHRPLAWPVPAEERVPELAAPRLYSDRWMFHGPRFQGVSELTGIGARHVRAVLTTPPAPGALLDNVGQVFGYWVMATLPERTIVFPMGMREIRFYGPHPQPGTRLDCAVTITSITDTTVVADAQLSVDGQVWAEFRDWSDRRFDSFPETVAVDRTPELATLSSWQPDGWALLFERWPDLASRELIMRNHFGSAERTDYEQSPPRGRRQFLLGRIAVKDAVRQWLWQHESAGAIFPAEVGVRREPEGPPTVYGVAGRRLPALDVSLAHTGEVGVAIVRPAGTGGCGIDVEEVVDRPAGAAFVALTEAEKILLAELVAASGEPEALWFTRFWTAKEAVAKAEGTGLDGSPRRFVVASAQPDRFEVVVAGRRREVRCTTVQHPWPGQQAARTYVVAWTTTVMTAATIDDEQEA